MHSEFYRFGGLTIRLCSDAPLSPSKFCAPFAVENSDFDHTVTLSFASVFPTPPQNAMHGEQCYRWYEGGRFCLLFDHGSGFLTFAVRCGDTTTLTMSERYRSSASAMTVLEAAGLFDLLADNGMLVLHSSYIVTANGEGIVFAGESGVGKSTQAELWRKFAAAEVINGDRALIRPCDATVHGILYSGTSNICRNVSAPLKVVVMPRQASRNAVFSLRPQEIFIRLLNQCAYYPWALDSATRMTELIETLISSVPIIGLDCRMDADAVFTLDEMLRSN